MTLLIPGTFAGDDPFTGLEETLQLFTLAAELGEAPPFVWPKTLRRSMCSRAGGCSWGRALYGPLPGDLLPPLR